MLATNVDNYLTLALEKFDKVKNTHTHMCIVEVALFVDLVTLSNGLHGSVQME